MIKLLSHSDPGQTKFHLCVCNVGDSLAYVYSGGQVGTKCVTIIIISNIDNHIDDKNHLEILRLQNSQVREATLGSHDITANRDMRDALGALGPVDGLNPELSNLTCRWRYGKCCMQ